jgi:putative hemolysin
VNPSPSVQRIPIRYGSRVSGTSPGKVRSAHDLDLRHGPYIARFATCATERTAALRLRFEVFNLELAEGLESAYLSGHDSDEFDAVCDHLVVTHLPTGKVVGTYRMQTGATAKANLGYYSEREFDFAPYEKLRPEVVELGRACIHRDHRSTDVLYLLWRGIAAYALKNKARYLLGCSSLTSQDPAYGMAVFSRLHSWQVEEDLRTVPLADFAMPSVKAGSSDDSVPKLLRTYLAIGAGICGPPAMDREFKTIDFLTLLDLERLHPRIRARFVEGL